MDQIRQIRDIKFTDSGNCYINNGANYIDKIYNECDKIFVKKLIDNTVYITFDELVKKTREMFKLFLSTNDKPYHILCPNKIGSEYIMISRLLDLIDTDKNFISLLKIEESDDWDIEFDTDLIHSNIIVFIDDWILSGCNVCSLVDNMTYPDYKKLYNIDLHLIVPYQSRINSLSQFKFKNIYQYNPIWIEEFKYNAPLSTAFKKIFENGALYPVYSDIKIPNDFSSFPYIYKHGLLSDNEYFGTILNTLPSRDVFELN